MKSKNEIDSEGNDHWTVYIIESQAGKLYTGITTDLARRFEQHASGRNGARFFKTSPPSRIVYSESAVDRSAASRRESAIKRMTRKQKLDLIGG